MNLKKYLPIIICLLYSQFTAAQYKLNTLTEIENGFLLNIEVMECNHSIKHSDNKNIIDYFEFENPAKPNYPKLPSSIIYIAIPPNCKAKIKLLKKSTSRLSNISPAVNPSLIGFSDTAYISNEENLSAEIFTSETYPGAELEILGYTWIRDYYCVALRLNSHLYHWKKSELEIIYSLELKLTYDGFNYSGNKRVENSEYENELSKIIINYSAAQEFKSIPNYVASDTTGSWIEYGKDYVKLAISNDGLYRISYGDLLSYTVNPATIQPKSLRIFEKGVEKEIFVSGEEDDQFDSDDYIEFYATKNYSNLNYKKISTFGEEYSNYFDRYSDTSIVWLTWGGIPGKRSKYISTFNANLLDTISSHAVFLHLEKDERLWYYDAVLPRINLPFYQENKIWTWQTSGSSGSRSFQFYTDNYLPDDSIKIIARIISNAADRQINAHKTGMSINSTSVKDSILYDFKKTVNFQSNFNSNNLVSGNNTLRIFGMTSDASFHQSLIDWIEIEFNRKNVVYNDSLLLRVKDVIINSERLVNFSGYTGDSASILIYKIIPTVKKIQNFRIEGTTNKIILFSDTVSYGDQYVVINKSKLLKPIFVTKKKFENLRNSTNGADYLLITNKLLSSSTSSYASFIESQYQQRTKLVYVDDIYDEFNFGNKSAESINHFLKFSYSSWTAPAPTYLLLVGDANYDFKHVVQPAPTVRKMDLVPSFGVPVSDAWFVMFDTINVSLQQMFVGRIPAENNEQLNSYLIKHQKYLQRKFDRWNKTLLFFSGGDPSKASELDQLREANNYIFNDLGKSKPIGGFGKHFYKTLEPPTNFGPFSQSEVNSAIDSGSIFISYIGHSGTQTWDNGITQVLDLMNNYSDRNPLITDFGCSTGRFAEPDVNAFGESFISNSSEGQAIAYLGNSSFGYLSTSLLFPKLFYKILMQDSVLQVGKIHASAKNEMLTQFGNSEVNRVFNYCNLLFGDPIIKIRIPEKPNFAIDKSSVEFMNKNPNDEDDSLTLKIAINNFGRVPNDSVNIKIFDYWTGSVVFSNSINRTSPMISDTITISVPINSRVGVHRLKIFVDSVNAFTEIYEDDNFTDIEYVVYSTNLRSLDNEKYYNAQRKKINIINPVSKKISSGENVILALSTDKDFSTSTTISKPLDSVITSVELPGLLQDKRYYWRMKIESSDSSWSDVFSFVNNDKDYSWYFDSTFSRDDIILEDVEFDSLSKIFSLTKKEIELKVISAGSNEGKYASIQYNNQEKLSNTFFWGIATAELDSNTLLPKNYRYFVYPSSTSGPALINYIDSLPIGAKLIMSVCDDAAQSVLGFSGGTAARNAIKQLGSLFIDSVKYRESWCIIGEKGAVTGSVPESYSKLFNGPAIVTSNKTLKADSGKIILPKMEGINIFNSLYKKDQIPGGARIDYTPIVFSKNEIPDTLNKLNFLSDSLDVSALNNKGYHSLNMYLKLYANNLYESPQLKIFASNYRSFPELAINYQVVSLDEDTITAGESTRLNFFVYNVGETKADSFNVLLTLVLPDNSIQTLQEFFIDTLNTFSRKLLSYNYNSIIGPNNRTFQISIDPENKIPEIFEDNNFFAVPFYVKGDTSKPAVKLFIDDNDFVNGDFISSTPTVRAELFDPSLILNNDTSSVQLFLDDKRIFNNDPDLTFTLSPTNPKITLTYKPTLAEGAHEFRVRGFNINKSDTDEVVQTATVSNSLQILSTYNYPNPFNSETYFTFRLPQVPDEIKIKIYTVAGRLVKEISLNKSQLKYDFNKIYWDGRDADGDLLANGVYIYKVILKKSDRTETITQKLAIAR